MSATFTLKLRPDLDAEIRRSAESTGKSADEVVREILEEAIERRLQFRRVIDRYAGCIDSQIEPHDDWAREIYKNNWRP